jgi:hypothetical protein
MMDRGDLYDLAKGWGWFVFLLGSALAILASALWCALTA